VLVELSETAPVEVLRVGTFTDRNGREIEVTEADLDALVANFEAGEAGQEVPLDVNHERKEAAGWLKVLWRDGDTLLGTPAWNALGEELVGGEVYKYLSATLDWANRVLKSVSLVNFPAVKGLRPLELAELVLDSEVPMGQLFAAHLHQTATGFIDAMMAAGMVTMEERKRISAALDAGLDAMVEALGPLGEGMMRAPDFGPYYFSEEPGDPAKEDVGMPDGQQDIEALRAEVRAELEEEMVDRHKREVELRAEIRREVEADLAAAQAERAELVAFAEEVCGGEVGLASEPGEVVEFLAAMQDDARDKAKALLRAKVVQFGEVGSSRDGEEQKVELGEPLAAALRTWVDGGGDVEEFFEVNRTEMGDAGQYDLSAFESEG
jgi:hypothetical protein